MSQIEPQATAPEPEAKRSSRTLVIVLVIALGGCALIIPVLAAILLPVFAQAKEQAKRTQSMGNIKQLNMSMLMYAADFDDRFTLKENWCDLIDPYVKSADAWKSPKGDEKVEIRYDYAMIAARSGQEIPPAPEAPTTPLLLESGLGTKNQSGHYEMLPKPARYHARGKDEGLIGYTDGHAKFVTYDSLGF